jgi:hypothetical protein
VDVVFTSFEIANLDTPMSGGQLSPHQCRGKKEDLWIRFHQRVCWGDLKSCFGSAKGIFLLILKTRRSGAETLWGMWSVIAIRWYQSLNLACRFQAGRGREYSDTHQVVSERDSVCILQTEDAKGRQSIGDSVRVVCRKEKIKKEVRDIVG